MSKLPNIRLDEQICVPLLRSHSSSGAPHVKPTSQTKGPGPASAKSGGMGALLPPRSHLGVLSLLSKRGIWPGRPPRGGKATMQAKADLLESLIDTLKKDDPLREDLQNQLDQLRAL